MSDTKTFSVWPFIIGFAAVSIGGRAIYHYAPALNFGAVSNAMESSAIAANVVFDVSMIEFSVNNESSYGYIDLEVDCTFRGASGTDIDTQTFVIYETFKPESLTNVSIISADIPAQASELHCQAEDATLTSQITCGHHTKMDGSGTIVKSCSEKPIS